MFKYCLLFLCAVLFHWSQSLPNFRREPNDDIIYDDDIDLNADKNDQSMTGRPLTDKDFEAGRQLTEEQLHGSDRKSDAVLMDKNKFEGDIILGNRTQPMFLNVIKDSGQKWTGGRIPYVLSDQYNNQHRAVIARVFEEFHNKTCIRFIPKRFYHLSYINIGPGNGCASLVGKQGGQQIVSLDFNCLTLGITEHELAHVIGLWHEQSRPDRDDWVKINWNNVEKGMEGNFVKFTWNEVQSLGVDYDYGSVMHYGTHAFAKGFGSTLSPLRQVPPGVQIGQRVAMSGTDLKKINLLYDCSATGRRPGILLSILRLIGLGR